MIVPEVIWAYKCFVQSLPQQFSFPSAMATPAAKAGIGNGGYAESPGGDRKRLDGSELEGSEHF